MRKSSAKATEINYQFEITYYGISSHFSDPASTLDKLRAFDGFISGLDKRLQTCWTNDAISVSATVHGNGENRITFTELMLIEEEKDIYYWSSCSYLNILGFTILLLGNIEWNGNALDIISKTRNTYKCMKVYFIQRIHAACFGHSCGHLQGVHYSKWFAVLATSTHPGLDGDLLHTCYPFPIRIDHKIFIRVLILNMYFKI